MASGNAGKSSILKNVVYDSRNDVPTGKKRAVDFTGGVSVAERARLFGPQITHSNVPKNPPLQRAAENKPSTRNFQPQKSNVRQNYSSPERVSNNVREQPTRIDDRTQREPAYYSTVTRSADRPQQRSADRPQQQRPVAPSTYDTFQSKPKKKPSSNRTNYSQISSGEPHQFPENFYVSGKPLRTNTNYFQPIRDPLEVLYPNSVETYPQGQIPMTINQNNDNTNGMHSFDLGNLINRIQDDYLSNVRPYVSSVEFIETELNRSGMGLMDPSTNRQNYSRPINDIYLRPNASYNYDIIDTNDLYQRYPRPIYQEVQRSSMRKRRRKHRRRYHDQASSPIHIFESSTRSKRRESSPPASSPKPSTPVPASPSEADEEEATVNTKTEEEAKTTEVETSSESEEEEVIAPPKPVTQPSPLIAPTSTPRPTPTTSARLPAKPVTSESSDSDESESESDEDDESDEEEEEVKPTSRPPLPRPTNVRTAPPTPQSITRIPPQRNSISNTDNINPVQETGSARSLDLQESKKSGVGGKLQSIFGRFRRRKS